MEVNPYEPPRERSIDRPVKFPVEMIEEPDDSFVDIALKFVLVLGIIALTLLAVRLKPW